MDQSKSFTNLLLSRISELEVNYPSEVADTRLFTELADQECVFDETALCQNFDNEVLLQNRSKPSFCLCTDRMYKPVCL